ncbi:MAG: hypothetical protein NTX26_01780 [Candidatus Parcubacteria bacterium]|nr:hypothetical protein [Candidatus Parcubacteria bacterium]
MSKRKVIFRDNAYYYLFNKCLDRRVLFKDEEDYLYFIYLLYYLNQQNSIELRHLKLKLSDPKHCYHFKTLRVKSFYYLKIIGFCLLPNCFSLNKKYMRSGPIFCGPFKSFYVERMFLEKILLLVHLLPLKLFRGLSSNKQCLKVKQYFWSSLPYYLGNNIWCPFLKHNKKLRQGFKSKTIRNAVLKKKNLNYLKITIAFLND